MRDSFTFYRSFFEGLDLLDDATFRRLMDAIIRYALNDEMPDLNGLEMAVFQSWKANVDASNRRRDNGKSGGRPLKKTIGYDLETEMSDGYELETENNRNVSWLSDEKPNKNIKENKNKNKKENGNTVRFTPPTAQEVRDYALEHSYTIDVDRFIDFYESKGWMVGKNKMKDWKAAVRNWARSQRPEKGTKFSNFEQRDPGDFDPYAMGLFANN